MGAEFWDSHSHQGLHILFAWQLVGIHGDTLTETQQRADQGLEMPRRLPFSFPRHAGITGTIAVLLLGLSCSSALSGSAENAAGSVSSGQVTGAPLGQLEQLTLPGRGGPELKVVGRRILDCDFGPQWDRDFDGWPDGWNRLRGPEYPRYPKVYMDYEESKDQENQALVPDGRSHASGKLSHESEPTAIEIGNHAITTGHQTSSADKTAQSAPGSPESRETQFRSPNGLCVMPQGGAVGLSIEMPAQLIHDHLAEVAVETKEFTGIITAELKLVGSGSGQPIAREIASLQVPGIYRDDPGQIRPGPQIPGIKLPLGTDRNAFKLRTVLPSPFRETKLPQSSANLLLELRVLPTSRSSCEGTVCFRRVRLWQLPHMAMEVFAQASSNTPGFEPGSAYTVRLLAYLDEDREVSAKGRLVGRSGLIDEFDIPLSPEAFPRGEMPTFLPVAASAGGGDDDRAEASTRRPSQRVWAGRVTRAVPQGGFYWLMAEIRVGGTSLIHQVAKGFAVFPNLTLPSAETLLPDPEDVTLAGEPSTCLFGWSLPPSAIAEPSTVLRKAWERLAPPVVRWELRGAKLPAGPEENHPAQLEPFDNLFIPGAGLLIDRPSAGQSDPVSRWGLELVNTPEHASRPLGFVQLGDEISPPARSRKEASEEIARLVQSGSLPLVRQLIVPFGEDAPPPENAGSADPQAPVPATTLGLTLSRAICAGLLQAGKAPGVTSQPTGKPEASPAAISAEYRTVLISSWPVPAIGPETSAEGQMVKAMCEAASAGAAYFFLRLGDSFLERMVSSEGEPRELYLPWYLSTRLLTDCQFVGPCPVDGGGEGRLFWSSEKAVLVLWSSERQETYLSFPEGGLVVDPLGKVDVVDPADRPVVLGVGPRPLFIVTQSLWPLLWQKEAQFQPAEIAPLPGRPQPVDVCFRNTTGSPVEGRFRLWAPAGFRLWPQEMSFELKPGESFRQQVEIVASPSVVGTSHRFALEWELRHPRQFQWTVYRLVKILWPGVTITARWQLTPSPGLVHVDLDNNTGEELRLIFEVFSPGQKRIATTPKTFSPGSHTLEIPCELAEPRDGSPIVLQIRDADSPRRLRLAVDTGKPASGQDVPQPAKDISAEHRLDN